MAYFVDSLPWVAIFFLSFAFFFLLHQRFKEKNVWSSIVKHYRKQRSKTLQAQHTEEVFVSRFGEIENKALLYRVDRMVLISGIKNYLPWMDGEKFIMLAIALGAAGLMEGAGIFSNVFAALFLMLAQPVVLYIIMLALANHTYNQIEDNTSLFVSILANHAKSSSDIVTIMQRTMGSLSGYLREVVERFISDAEKEGDIDVAFDYMKESIDNRQLRTIIMNLKNCSHYQANFEEVLGQMMGQVTAELSAREDRKNALFEMKMTLGIILLMALLIVWLIGNGLGIDVQYILLNNLAGQFLLFVSGFLLLMVLVKMFATDK